MKRQEGFEPRDYRSDADYQVFDSKFRQATNLEYAVLLGHVMIEDQLLALLAARLDADTMPSLRGFELIAGLALAGEKAEHLREIAGYLNGARNEVGHKMYRKNFLQNVERFVRAVKGKTGKTMKWPGSESEQIDELRIAIRFFMVHIAVAIEHEAKLHELGLAMLKRRLKSR